MPASSAEVAGAAMSRRQRAVRALAAIGLVFVLVPVGLRLFGIESGPAALLVALVPWATFACVVPITLAAASRAWWVAGAALGAMLLGLAWMAPLYVTDGREGAPVLRVATVNATFGRADADAVVQLVADYDIDLLVVVELTPESVANLRGAGLDDVLGHSVVYPETNYAGAGLWSRTEVCSARQVGSGVSRHIRAELQAMDGRLTVFAVHPAAPGLSDNSRWAQETADLAQTLRSETGEVLVAGDFNMTRDHRVFRGLEAHGYRDAADQAGAGFLPTFPQGRAPWPFVAIDHVLTRDSDMWATAVETVTLPNADHRALVVTYAAEENGVDRLGPCQ